MWDEGAYGRSTRWQSNGKKCPQHTKQVAWRVEDILFVRPRTLLTTTCYHIHVATGSTVTPIPPLDLKLDASLT